MEWEPHVTVATIVEDSGKFLLVEERSNGNLVFNQPAGHLEEGETLQEAAIRETYEETGWRVELQGFVGLALYQSAHNNVTYHRTTFFAKAISHDPDLILDDGIEQAVWMTYDEMLTAHEKMRSVLVIRAVEQYMDGNCFPLSVIYE